VYRHRSTGEFRRSLRAIARLNALLRQTFSPRHLLDFHSSMGPDDFMDDLHMNSSGQAERAESAYRGLTALAEVTPPPAGVRALRWSAGHWRPKTQADVPAFAPVCE
jgi:hypothetical protein